MHANVRANFTLLDEFATNQLDMRPQKQFPPALTAPQRAALTFFQDGRWKGVFPVVNPRTAAALLSFGLLECERVNGRRVYRISNDGMKILNSMDI